MEKQQQKQNSLNQTSTKTSERTKRQGGPRSTSGNEVTLQKISHILDEKAFTGEGGKRGPLPAVHGQLPRWGKKPLSHNERTSCKA